MINFLIYMQVLRTVFSIFLLIVIFMICIIRYLLNMPFNLTFNPPKAHAFVEKAFESATSNVIVGMVALSPFIFNVVLSSAYLYAAGMYFSTFLQAISPVMIPAFIRIAEFIIQNTLDMHTDAWAYINNPNISLEMLRELHGYLTPYLRSYNTIFRFLSWAFMCSPRTDSDQFDRVQSLISQLSQARMLLLDVYRSVEERLSIPIHESPISF